MLIKLSQSHSMAASQCDPTNVKLTYEEKQKRTADLNSALKARGLWVIYSDDCWNYIKGSSKLKLEQVVESMVPNHERACELKVALKARGLKRRQDSALCKQYELGITTKTLDEIVDTCELMNFLYTKTNFAKLVAANNSRDVERFHEDRTWPDEQAASENAKYPALEEYFLNNVSTLSQVPVSVRTWFLKNSTTSVEKLRQKLTMYETLQSIA